MNRLLLIAAFAALAPAAFAQDSAAPAAAAIPPPNCTQPALQTDDKGKIKNAKELNEQTKTYQTCMNAYVDEQKKQALDLDAQARAHLAASNAAVGAFNDFAKRVNAAAAAAQPKSGQQ